MSGKDFLSKKISDAAALASASIAVGDLIPMEDVSTGNSVNVTASSFLMSASIANLATLASTAVTTGDFVIVWDASAAAFVKVDATKLTWAS